MPATPFAPFLADRSVVILDGGLATELERRGAELHDPLWSARALIEQPDLIVGTHTAYFEAGADVAITASYQASFEGFAARGIGEREGAALMRGSILLAQRARDAWIETAPPGRLQPLVAASIGPYGAVRADGSEYTGDYDRTTPELRTFHARRLEVLADPEAGADLLAVETIPSIQEAVALAEALAAHPSMPAWVSFSCRDGARICDGTPLAEAIRTVTTVQNVVAVGVNCTAPAYIGSLVGIAAAHTDLPVLTYPNRGAAYDPIAKTWEGPGDEDLGMMAKAWVRAGASLVGGCCGTGPEDIRSIATAIGT
jgi:homocysteine S-methyltransferase